MKVRPEQHGKKYRPLGKAVGDPPVTIAVKAVQPVSLSHKNYGVVVTSFARAEETGQSTTHDPEAAPSSSRLLHEGLCLDLFGSIPLSTRARETDRVLQRLGCA